MLHPPPPPPILQPTPPLPRWPESSRSNTTPPPTHVPRHLHTPSVWLLCRRHRALSPEYVGGGAGVERVHLDVARLLQHVLGRVLRLTVQVQRRLEEHGRVVLHVRRGRPEPGGHRPRAGRRREVAERQRLLQHRAELLLLLVTAALSPHRPRQTYRHKQTAGTDTRSAAAPWWHGWAQLRRRGEVHWTNE